MQRLAELKLRTRYERAESFLPLVPYSGDNTSLQGEDFYQAGPNVTYRQQMNLVERRSTP